MWLYIFSPAPAAGIVFSVAFLAVAVGAYFIFRALTLTCLSELASRRDDADAIHAGALGGVEHVDDRLIAGSDAAPDTYSVLSIRAA